MNIVFRSPPSQQTGIASMAHVVSKIIQMIPNSTFLWTKVWFDCRMAVEIGGTKHTIISFYDYYLGLDIIMWYPWAATIHCNDSVSSIQEFRTNMWPQLIFVRSHDLPGVESYTNQFPRRGCDAFYKLSCLCKYPKLLHWRTLHWIGWWMIVRVEALPMCTRPSK